MPTGDGRPLTYEEAGVDIAAAERAVERIKAHVRSTFRPEVIGDVGGFGGCFSIAGLGRRDPVLVASTDGVGTKSVIARMTGRHGTIGVDLVAMNVDDVAAQGAEPLFLLDYISIGRLSEQLVDELVTGIAEGCRQAGCALLGGEMSEHPDVMAPGEYDLVGFAVGVADRGGLLPRGVRPGDRLVGLASPGLRCNGYSLARRALLERAGRRLEEPAWRGAHHSLGDELLTPSVVYAPALGNLLRHVEVHAFAHVTGGGLPGNLARVIPPHCDAIVWRGTWPEPRVFAEIARCGPVTDREMFRVFNMGVGMVAVVTGHDALAAVDTARAAGHDAWVIGEIGEGRGRVQVRPSSGP